MLEAFYPDLIHPENFKMMEEENDYESWQDFEDEDIEDEQQIECKVCLYQQFYSEDGNVCLNCGNQIFF
ncbi:hypothetical protein AHMF7605_11970 [Adhaeribacter arboris]|uniref:Uncharacterized protein n=1 Tax=Adhaeribacter arboris TaxID=2072846 RepID=A0A2T2YFF0_9BACT|nr:hypothetical protein [Adhaeribacter arboris]PSR54188.1 hypothetical protein AHMF7605_11970 [Adhaeribacter arboris]